MNKCYVYKSDKGAYRYVVGNKCIIFGNKTAGSYIIMSMYKFRARHTLVATLNNFKYK